MFRNLLFSLFVVLTFVKTTPMGGFLFYFWYLQLSFCRCPSVGDSLVLQLGTPQCIANIIIKMLIL